MKAQSPKIIIITGLSGSGKSTALAALEDCGFFCVDNLPAALLPKFLELQVQTISEVTRFAFVMDLREKDFLARYESVFADLKAQGFSLEIVFLEASEDALLRRYSETRRHHPLSDEKGLLQGIRTEKDRLARLRGIAGRVIDSTKSNVHELKALILELAEKDIRKKRLWINVLSFGFKYGIPRDADLVMDVRFLPNPFFVPELKNQDGQARQVRDFVLDRNETKEFMKKYIDMLDYLVPLYEREGKSYLTLAVGCTGGRHRSVAVADAVYEHLTGFTKNISLAHRDMER